MARLRPTRVGVVPAAMSLLFTSLLAAWSYLSGLGSPRLRTRVR